LGRFKIALCQMQVIDDKRTNIRKAKALIKEAKENGASMVVLPEMFNCPYSNDYFKEYAEDLYDGITVEKLTKYALNNNVYIVGGSIPE